LITGSSGLLGSEVMAQAASMGFQHLWGTWCNHRPSHRPPEAQLIRLDIGDEASVKRVIQDLRPHVVIHTAYSKKPDLTEQVTAQGTAHVAQALANSGARLVHVSSDVIFDGEHGPYDESAIAAPVHAYGRAKAAAERAVAVLSNNLVVVRTSLITRLQPLDPVSDWIVSSLRQGQPITLFTDELRTPVWVQDLAVALLELACGSFGGILNVAGPQSLSRYQMGQRLALHFGLDPDGISAGSSLESGLTRPRDCRLDTRLARQVLRTRLRSFDEGLSAL
jgi:dTDP-4-dehydrorhamnose reductase